MKKILVEIGADKVFLVVIDGGADWAVTEEMIKEFFPWISFMHCTSHEVSLIIKDCFKEGGITELYELDDFVTRTQHWFSTHSCKSFLLSQARDDDPTAFVWPVVTRYCGKLLKMKRFNDMKELLCRVVVSGVYVEKNFAEDTIAPKISGTDV